jgi:hypothetical protein
VWFLTNGLGQPQRYHRNGAQENAPCHQDLNGSSVDQMLYLP